MKTLFEISRSGLQASERALSVTSNNVINADTAGYTRQRLEQTPNGMQMSDRHAGLGVNVGDVVRLRNEMQDELLREKRQDMGYMEGKKRVYEQLEASFTSDSGGDLDLRIGRLFDTFSELSADPQDMSVRNNLISEAVQLTRKMEDMDSSLERVSELTRDSGVKTVSRVNELLRDLSSLNQAIRNGEAQGKPDHASLDLQVSKLEELSELVDFESQKSDSGALEIRIGGVQVLDENRARVIRPEVDDTDKSFRLRLDDGKLVEPAGGELGAQMEMYSRQMPELSDRLDRLAETMVNEFNDLHRSGYGLEDQTARDFFDADGMTAATLQVNGDLQENHRHIAASDTPEEAGNGEIASRIADLRNETVIGNRKMVDYSIDLISSPGGEVSNLSSKIETRDSEIAMLETQQEREAGVNIDEELSQLIRHQNAYQGAARVMNMAQNMYDTLLETVR